ncbi:hypothetical protein B0H10DRAFT_1957608 [Mycena sp. CBHHK59/15]|nr:hypothetical protein B0H10DRAFT_1957608 [Mycena sp. CBHHK59/15]
MSSRIDNHWDRILAAPPPSLEELAADFPGYTFDTIGWGEDQEIVVTSLPPHMEARLPNVGTPSHPPLDLSTIHHASAPPARPRHGVYHAPRHVARHTITCCAQELQLVPTSFLIFTAVTNVG